MAPGRLNLTTRITDTWFHSDNNNGSKHRIESTQTLSFVDVRFIVHNQNFNINNNNNNNNNNDDNDNNDNNDNNNNNNTRQATLTIGTTTAAATTSLSSRPYPGGPA